MTKLLFLAFLLSQSAFALEAVVTVLETPLLKYKSADAPVVQYLRKGDVIKIHPSIANDRSLDKLAPPPAKLAAIQKKIKESSDWHKDPLFLEKKYRAYFLEDEFIPTFDRQGNEVFVMSSHLYVYFETSRESLQVGYDDDPTDYRLEEPLPKTYPFIQRTGYRGQVTLGFTQPYYESYPYHSSALTKSYSSPVDLNVALLKQVPKHTDDRYFWGLSLNLRHFENSYDFASGRSSKEEGLRFGAGPVLSYDAFKSVKDRVNLSGHVLFNFFNRLQVDQKGPASTDSRTYTAYTLTPKVAVQYHRKDVLEEIDFILGTSMEMETPARFTSNSVARRAAWWQDGGTDTFTTRPAFAVSGFLGFQTAY